MAGAAGTPSAVQASRSRSKKTCACRVVRTACRVSVKPNCYSSPGRSQRTTPRVGALQAQCNRRAGRNVACHDHTRKADDTQHCGAAQHSSIKPAANIAGAHQHAAIPDSLP